MSPQFAPNGLNPVYIELEAIKGQTFRRKVIIWEDEKKTKRMNLAGLVVALFIPDWPLELKAGSGLTVTAASGEILITLTPNQTASAPEEQMGFYLEVKENEQEKDCPLHGKFIFATA